MIKQMLAVLSGFSVAGCLSVTDRPAASSPCSFDQVWEMASAALADFPFEALDKASGMMETQWVDVEASTQAGALQRDVNKERIRYVIDVKPDGGGASASVLQLREAWSPMGVRSRQWRAIPGKTSEEEAVATAIARRFKDQGC
jgi:hypothetical protein